MRKGLVSDKLTKLRFALGVTGMLLVLAFLILMALAALVALPLFWPSIVSTIEGFNRITWLTIVLWFLFWASSKANERAQKSVREFSGSSAGSRTRAERPAQT